MEVGRLPYDVLILVCTNLRDDGRASCGARGSALVHEELKRRVKALSLPVRIRVSRAGCLDMCAFGTNVMVVPPGRMYSGVRLEDVDALLAVILGSSTTPPDRVA